MLVLTRNSGESIIIDGLIEVVLIATKGEGKARIGIIAPSQVTVDRKEVHLQKIADQRNAAIKQNAAVAAN